MSLDSFVTPRLRGERLQAGHRPELRRLHSDHDVMALLGGVRDEAQTSAYLDFNLGHWDQYGHGIYLLREHGNETLAGLGCLRHLTLDGEDEIEIGYSFFTQYWGRGLGTEVARACLELGFRGVGVASLIAVTHPENVASQRIMQKVGMQFDREAVVGGGPAVVYRGIATR